jgi:hypothetical protein
MGRVPDTLATHTATLQLLTGQVIYVRLEALFEFVTSTCKKSETRQETVAKKMTQNRLLVTSNRSSFHHVTPALFHLVLPMSAQRTYGRPPICPSGPIKGPSIAARFRPIKKTPESTVRRVGGY